MAKKPKKKPRKNPKNRVWISARIAPQAAKDLDEMAILYGGRGSAIDYLLGYEPKLR